MRRLPILILIAFLPLKFTGQCFSFTIQATAETCSGCCDGTASISNLVGGCGLVEYNWSPGSPIGDGTDSIFNLCPGIYSVVIHDWGMCCPDSVVSCNVDVATSMNSPQNISAIDAFVVNNLLSIKNLKNDEAIYLYDLNGRNVFAAVSIVNSEKIDLSSFSKQIYILLVSDKEKNIVFRKKIVW